MSHPEPLSLELTATLLDAVVGGKVCCEYNQGHGAGTSWISTDDEKSCKDLYKGKVVNKNTPSGKWKGACRDV